MLNTDKSCSLGRLMTKSDGLKSKRGQWWYVGVGLFSVLLCFCPLKANSQSQDVFNVGFSSALFREVNENDAMASVRVWSHAFVEERNIPATPTPFIFSDLSEIKEALKNGEVDCVGVTTDEFMNLREMVAEDAVIAGVISGSITEEYLLLVNRQSNIEKLSDLRGRSLGLLSSVRASLAPVWLDVLLAEEGLETAALFFDKIESNSKIAKVALSVFFGQLDACVVTRRGFDTMVELNPQTGDTLQTIAISPPVVPSIFCFRKDYDSPLQTLILNEITRWHLSPAGRQSLTIFQTDSLQKETADCMKSAMDLLMAHRKLSGEAIAGMPAEKLKADRIEGKE